MRRMVRETRLSVADLILPLFVREGQRDRREIPSMPGVAQLSIDLLVDECRTAERLGIPAVLLFGIPEKKDELGSESWNPEGVIQRSVRAVKQTCKDLVVITDVCFCEYTNHGHCGLLVSNPDGVMVLDNDGTLIHLAGQALSHAEAGADIVAPSGMIDGMVAAIRGALDKGGYTSTAILSYSAKYASGYYGPFRDAAESSPAFGDRSSYQMDPANVREALREVGLDVEEGADLVMVKPALHGLDVIRRVKDAFGLPTAAYHVSGEYAMLKAAVQRGWLDERRCVLETAAAIKRAGADLIVTYYAKDLAAWLS